MGTGSEYLWNAGHGKEHEMKVKDLPIDLSKHVIYTKNAKKCVQKLLHRY